MKQYTFIIAVLALLGFGLAQNQEDEAITLDPLDPDPERTDEPPIDLFLPPSRPNLSNPFGPLRPPSSNNNRFGPLQRPQQPQNNFIQLPYGIGFLPRQPPSAPPSIRFGQPLQVRNLNQNYYNENELRQVFGDGFGYDSPQQQQQEYPGYGRIRYGQPQFNDGFENYNQGPGNTNGFGGRFSQLYRNQPFYG